MEAHDDDGLGRFGMGLPNSSVSQCKHVEVYSWQKPGKVHFAELDIDKIRNNKLQEYDEIESRALPSDSSSPVTSSRARPEPWLFGRSATDSTLRRARP